MAAGGWDADVRGENLAQKSGLYWSVKFYLSLEDDEHTSGVWSWKINEKEMSDFFHCLFLFATFCRISEYS